MEGIREGGGVAGVLGKYERVEEYERGRRAAVYAGEAKNGEEEARGRKSGSSG